MKYVISIGFFLLAAGLSHADPGLDQASQTALGQTQQLLNDPGQRGEAIKQSADAHFVDQQVRGLAGSQAGADAIYGGAAQAMGEITRTTGGDSKKMMEMVNAAKSDPEGFANSLSPEMKARIHEIANQISPPAADAARP